MTLIFMPRLDISPLATQAQMFFENGYGISVLYGFGYSNRHTNPDLRTYEVAVIDHHNNIVYSTPITNDVLPYQTEEELFDVINQIKSLPPIKEAINKGDDNE